MTFISHLSFLQGSEGDKGEEGPMGQVGPQVSNHGYKLTSHSLSWLSYSVKMNIKHCHKIKQKALNIFNQF